MPPRISGPVGRSEGILARQLEGEADGVGGLGQLLGRAGVVRGDVVGDRGRRAREVLLLEGFQGPPVPVDEDELGDGQRDEGSEDQRAGKQNEKADPAASRTPTHDSDIIAAAVEPFLRRDGVVDHRARRFPPAGPRRGRAPSTSCRARGRAPAAPRRARAAEMGRAAASTARTAAASGFRQSGARAGDLERGRDAPRHRFPVPQPAEVSGGLDRVAERVPEVEQPAPPRILRIGGHDPGLDADRARQQVEQRRLLAREDLPAAGARRARPAARRRSRRPCTPRRGRPGSRGRAASPRRAGPRGSPRARWYAPSRFLPRRWLTPVLPPIAASAIPAVVVGTAFHATPRSRTAAAKPTDVRDDAAADGHEGVVAPHPGRDRGVRDARRPCRASWPIRRPRWRRRGARGPRARGGSARRPRPPPARDTRRNRPEGEAR